MLTYLRIRNFGIFSDVEIELGPGLTVFTGETGAGKSMIVDAVMACLGQRTSRDLIRSGADRAVIELVARLPSALDISADEALSQLIGESREVALQKDILADRSYQRINGKVVTSSLVSELGSRLVDIHGQQDQQTLLKPQNYLAILDSLGKDSAIPLKTEFASLYRKRQEILSRMAELAKDASARQREIDLLEYQVNEIEKARLKPGEEEELSRQYTVLSSQRKLLELCSQAYRLMYEGGAGTVAASESLSQAAAFLKKAASIDPSAGQALEALVQATLYLETGIDQLRDYMNKLSLDPDRLRLIEDRLDLIQRLKAKYGNDVDEVLDYAKKARQRLEELSHIDETLSILRKNLDDVHGEMVRLGAELTKARKEIAQRMELSVTQTARALGMPGAVFVVKFEQEQDTSGVPTPWGTLRAFPDGFDRVSFLFSANAGENPMPVHKVASGGELSRLMLALKSHMEEADPVPTLIFDEIDAGIGGKAGQAVAEKLWQLGRYHQVLCVTHLASIAAMADHHFLVSKSEKDGRTFAAVRELDEEERAHELARMLSGSDVSISVEHGRELLRSAQQYKRSSRK